MLHNVYTLYDVKALVYSPPFLATAHGSAMRMVVDIASDPNTSVCRHPEDYTLYCVGQWNDATGNMLPSATREHISDCSALAPGGRQRDFFTDSNGNTAAPNGSHTP